MKTKLWILLLGIAVAVACGKTTYTVSGSCPDLQVSIFMSGGLNLAGPCDLGPAGKFTFATNINSLTLNTVNQISIDGGLVSVSNASVLYSKFEGTLDLRNFFTADFFPIVGTVTFNGGTGPYSDATGSAAVDGGWDTNAGTVSLLLNGSLSY